MNVKEIDDAVIWCFLDRLEKDIDGPLDGFHYWAIMTLDGKFVGLCLPGRVVHTVDSKGYLNSFKSTSAVHNYFASFTGTETCLVDLPPY